MAALLPHAVGTAIALFAIVRQLNVCDSCSLTAPAWILWGGASLWIIAGHFAWRRNLLAATMVSAVGCAAHALLFHAYPAEACNWCLAIFSLGTITLVVLALEVARTPADGRRTRRYMTLGMVGTTLALALTSLPPSTQERENPNPTVFSGIPARDRPAIFVVVKEGCGRCPSGEDAVRRRIVRNLPETRTVRLLSFDEESGRRLLERSGAQELPLFVVLQPDGRTSYYEGLAIADFIDAYGTGGANSVEDRVRETVPEEPLLKAILGTRRMTASELDEAGPVAVLATDVGPETLRRLLHCGTSAAVRWAAAINARRHGGNHVLESSVAFLSRHHDSEWVRNAARRSLAQMQSTDSHDLQEDR